MSATVRWNRLEVTAKGDGEFERAIRSAFDQWERLPHSRLELDLVACRNVGEPGFKALGSQLVDLASRRELVVRVAPDLAGFFQGSGLASLMLIQVIEPMNQPVRVATTDFHSYEGDDTGVFRDDTNPPTGDTKVTRNQASSTGATLVDEEDGREFTVGKEVLVGREPPAEPAFPIPTISKQHFRIYRQGAGYFIEDLRSTNGTYLNGNPLTQPQPLGDGDEIVVAITLKHPEGARRFKFKTG
jgi:hypothetical protein